MEKKNKEDKGGFVTYRVDGVSTEMSFLEMFDFRENYKKTLQKVGRIIVLLFGPTNIKVEPYK